MTSLVAQCSRAPCTIRRMPPLTTKQVIKGFPPAIREVPEDPAAWLAWRKKVLAFRELCHRQADEDPEKRAALIKLAGESPAFFMAVFGVIHEPRNIVDMDLDAD